jgi:hypothetical protein
VEIFSRYIVLYHGKILHLSTLLGIETGSLEKVRKEVKKMSEQAMKSQHVGDVVQTYPPDTPFFVPSTEDREVVIGNISLEDSVNSPPCDCTACGSCRCTPCK